LIRNSPIKNTVVCILDINISTILSPVVIDERNLNISDSTLFATPRSHKSRDVDVQTSIQSPAITPPIVSIEEEEDESEATLPPYVNLIFSHMNEVNQWINQFCADTQTIQNDIFTIRVR
jgi:hypothetical protein